MASIAFIGLGNMGGPMAANLVKAGHKVIAFDLVATSRDQAKADGAAIAESSVSSWDRVTPEYFQALGQPILRGRGVTEADSSNTAPIAVVNQAFVRQFFWNEDPIDKRFGIDSPANASTFRIVGVVQDAKYGQPRKPARPMFFVPLAQYASYKEGLNAEDRIELAFHRQRPLGDA